MMCSSSAMASGRWPGRSTSALIVGGLLLLLSGCHGRTDAPPTQTAAPAEPATAEAPAEPAEAPSIVLQAADGTERRWTEAALDEALPGKRTTIELDSPVYKKRMRYEGFWLADVLAATAPKAAWTGSLSFRCADGYTPTVPVDQVEPLKLFFAVGQPDLPDGARWALLGTTSPAPFYVVSPVAGAYEQFPWPFQLLSIEAIDLARAYPAIVPTGAAADSAASRGFERFVRRCVSCHAINGQGGVIGPELNAPLSVTEYWKRPLLKQFILDPASVRARSKMPPPGLPEAEVDDLLAYLEHMAKLPRPAVP